jgi:uncharacterized membrane protein
MIAVVCVIIGLAGFGKLRESYYPYLIGTVGLALLLQSTLISSGLIGSDVHTEYYFYYKALNGWNYADPHPYNSAAGSTLLAPFLTNVFHIPGYWIYKLVFPLIFSVVPVLLYYVFRKEFGAKVAFFASLFFVIVPTWSMELIGIPRQMLGEVMLALCLFVVIVSKWRLLVKVPLLIVFGVIGATFHYIMGPIILLYLCLGGFFLLFFKRRVFPVKWMSLIVGVLVICNVAYYGWVCKGMPLTCLTTGSDIVVNLIVDIFPSSMSFLKPDVEIPVYPYIEPGTEYPEGMSEEIDKVVAQAEDDITTTTDNTTSYLPGFIANTDPVIKAAWGGDFNQVDVWGKVFRVIQYATQLCIIVGCIVMVKNRKKYSAEYLCFCGAAAFMLGMCMFVPHFAAMINATRFYHLSLFVLAPVFVVGGMTIFRNMKILSLGLIIPYFVFTSGAMFELTQQTNINQINMPYSISLSNHRVDMVGVFTENDLKVRDWAVENNLVINMYADTHSQLILWEKAYTYWRDLRAALETKEFKTGKYIFLSERNNKDQVLVLRPDTGGSSSGRRIGYTYEDVGLDKVIAEGTIVYQQGDAFILEVANGPD